MPPGSCADGSFPRTLVFLSSEVLPALQMHAAISFHSMKLQPRRIVSTVTVCSEKRAARAKLLAGPLAAVREGISLCQMIRKSASAEELGGEAARSLRPEEFGLVSVIHEPRSSLRSLIFQCVNYE